MVDTTVADGGLAAILAEAKVSQELIDTIGAAGIGCISLDDVLDCVTKEKWETELKSVFLDKCSDDATKASTLQLARLRQAYKMGVAARNRSDNVGAGAETDVEKPLDAADALALRQNWKQTYQHVEYDEFLTPADNVVARIYREFRRKSHTLLPVTRVRSLAFDRRPVQRARREIADGVVIETDARKEIAVRDLNEYVWGLKILAVCWTLCGNYKTKSSRGDKKADILYCTHTEAFGYADRVLRKAMQHAPARSALEWIRDRDESTRATAVMKARSEIPWGEALVDAWAEHRLEWNSSGGRTAERELDEEDNFESAASRRVKPRKGSAAEERAATPKGKVSERAESERPKQLYASTLPGGKHVCKAWVNGMCTKKESDCPNKRVHACDIILPSGKVCGGNHRRAGHKSSDE